MDAFRYTSAQSSSQAIELAAKSPTAQGGATIRLIAGGTNLVDLMKLNVERPVQVVGLEPSCLFPLEIEKPRVDYLDVSRLNQDRREHFALTLILAHSLQLKPGVMLEEDVRLHR